MMIFHNQSYVPYYGDYSSAEIWGDALECWLDAEELQQADKYWQKAYKFIPCKKALPIKMLTKEDFIEYLVEVSDD